jgi:hypothetical protein
MTLRIEGGPTTNNIRLMAGDTDLLKLMDVSRIVIEPMDPHQHVKVTLEVIGVVVDVKVLPNWVQLKLKEGDEPVELIERNEVQPDE